MHCKHRAQWRKPTTVFIRQLEEWVGNIINLQVHIGQALIRIVLTLPNTSHRPLSAYQTIQSYS